MAESRATGDSDFPPRVAVIVSPNYGDYAQLYLHECIKSVVAQVFAGSIRIFLVDNESTAESYGFLLRHAPQAVIIRCTENMGFAGGNNLAMRAACDEGFEYLLLLNMDTIMGPGCIEELLEQARQHKQAAAVQARLMLWPEKDKVNSAGNQTHFLGFGFCRGYGAAFDAAERASPIAHPSGAAVLLRAAAVAHVGFFDETFWMYCEDLDLGWRFWLAGYECWFAPAAVVYHKYVFFTGPEKFYRLDRNRILAVLKNYHWATLLLIIPPFMVMEFGTMMHAVSHHWLRRKLCVWAWFLNPAHRRTVIRARKRTQSLRLRKERDIVKLFCGRIDFPAIDSMAMRWANMVLAGYWRVARRLIFW